MSEYNNPLAGRIDAAAADADRLCAELKGQLSRAKRLVEEAKTFLEEAGQDARDADEAQASDPDTRTPSP